MSRGHEEFKRACLERRALVKPKKNQNSRLLCVLVCVLIYLCMSAHKERRVEVATLS